MLIKVLNEVKTHYVHTSFQKGFTQEWLIVLSWNLQGLMRGMISWPKRKYLHTTATTSPTATISTTADASWRKRQS